MIKAVLFDLDGTLLPMDLDQFCKAYFPALAQKLAPFGYGAKEVIGGIMKGTSAMIANDGKLTNEEVFWSSMEKDLGPDIRQSEPILDAYYRNEFDTVRDHCGYQPMAKKIVDFCHAHGLVTVLATNPLFPAIATEKRMSWVDLSPDDFALFTHYSNCRYSKPNPDYYRDIAERIGIAPEHCLMVGNDVGDDMVAKDIGMKVFLLPEWLINKKEKDLSVYPSGDFNDLMAFMESELS